MGYDLYGLQNNVDALTSQGKYTEAIELLKRKPILFVMKMLCKALYSMS